MRSSAEIYESAREQYRRRRRFLLELVPIWLLFSAFQIFLAFNSTSRAWRAVDWIVAAFDLAFAFFLYIRIRKKFPPV